MATSVLTTITANDYADLEQSYSEKNIINSVSGYETIVSYSNSVTVNNGTRDIEAHMTPSGYFMYPMQAQPWATKWTQIHNQDVFARDEYAMQSGTFTFTTNTMIDDISSVSVIPTVTYTPYYDNDTWDFVTYSNYNTPNYAVFWDIRGMHAGSTQTGTRLPRYSTTIWTEDLGLMGGSNWFSFNGNTHEQLSSSVPMDKIEFSAVRDENTGEYTITVNYNICIWWAYQNLHVYKRRQEHLNRAFQATRFELRVIANSVETKEVIYLYERQARLFGGAQGKDYKTESNELLQLMPSSAVSNRQSYKNSQEILEKFDNDRTIVKFRLLNCEKYKVNNEIRYLQAEDLIYIKDENGQFIADVVDNTGELVPSIFEVLKTSPIWNGSFEMEVTCRKIDMTT